ncbi:MAG: glutamine--tRNA ligase/YqeY domain fusion protein [Acholeplasmatales bacterium]|nr:MAG: glutamine--tRNA ligase/YqeY domain fusion protein [Acholeplasmatales bacterium]
MENKHFIRTIIEEDIKSGKHAYPVTRFPPEPNGFLHLGHARAIIMNHALAEEYGGYFNLRFDDTNPVKEDTLFVEAMQADIAWLGCHWKHLLFASDYFETMYQRAMVLVEKGLAYVCDLTAEEVRATRGDLRTPGQNSPYRTRSIAENKTLFKNMRDGHYPDGARTLRAKIDMANPNMNMRDPVIYRIQRAHHHRTGDDWCIYPMYDFAHPLEDAIEGITHSLCSLEFEDHRPIYDWFVKHTDMPDVPRQIEFGKLMIADQVTGKRHIKKLVDAGLVDGWDDPRLITLSGLRRRGVPPQAIHRFIHALGLPKSQGDTDIQMFYEYVRDYLGESARRIHAVLDPVKVVITNYPSDTPETLEAPFHRDAPELGTRKIHFGKELYIEREDFIEAKPNKKWKRWALDVEVRLMHAYFVKAHQVVKDADGVIQEIHATYDKDTQSGSGFDARKPNGTIHFVEAHTAQPVEIRLFEPLLKPSSDPKAPYEARLNPDSRRTVHGFIEGAVIPHPHEAFQFTRIGYFALDPDSQKEAYVFNRVVELKSSFKPTFQNK